MKKTRSTRSPDEARAALLAAALARAGEQGWTPSMLSAAAHDAGLDRARARLVCVDGVKDLLAAFCADGDERMKQALDRQGFDDLSLTRRVAGGVRARLEVDAAHKPAVREAVKAFAQPINAATALRCLMATSDAIWRAAGDTATGLSFYTRRMSLIAVYAATLIYWLGDRSAGHEKSWRFLDNRLNDVMNIARARSQIGTFIAHAPSPGDILAILRKAGRSPPDAGRPR